MLSDLTAEFLISSDSIDLWRLGRILPASTPSLFEQTLENHAEAQAIIQPI